MRRFIALPCIFAVSLSAVPAGAQTPDTHDDVVMLANGGRLRGAVMEEDPVKGVRIKLVDGTVKTVAHAAVKEVRYGSPAPEEAPEEPAPAPPSPPGPGSTAGETPQPAIAPGSASLPAPPPSEASDEVAKARRAKASAPRFIVETLASGLGGALLAYGTFKAACGNASCLGGAIGGMAVNIAISPLVAWGVGNAMGGKGSLGMTYVVGLAPFMAAAGPGIDPLTLLGVEMALEPLCAAIGYEVSSQMAASKLLGPGGSIHPSVTPILGRGDSVRGVASSVAVTF